MSAGERADAPYKGSKDYLESFRRVLGLDGRYLYVEDRTFPVKNTKSRFGDNVFVLEATSLSEAYDVQNIFLTFWARIVVKQSDIKNQQGQVIGHEEYVITVCI